MLLSQYLVFHGIQYVHRLRDNAIPVALSDLKFLAIRTYRSMLVTIPVCSVVKIKSIKPWWLDKLNPHSLGHQLSVNNTCLCDMLMVLQNNKDNSYFYIFSIHFCVTFLQRCSMTGNPVNKSKQTTLRHVEVK